MEPCSIRIHNESFFCHCNQRVENESRKKKAAAEGKMVKEEDPYGGSTDENTDAEAEQDHAIPELPGMSLFVLISLSSCLFYLFLFLSQGHISFFVRHGKH